MHLVVRTHSESLFIYGKSCCIKAVKRLAAPVAISFLLIMILGCGAQTPSGDAASGSGTPGETPSGDSATNTPGAPLQNTIVNGTNATGRSIWVTAYYAGYMQSCGGQGYLSAGQIDYSAVSHIIHFGLVPQTDGTLDDSSNCISAANSLSLVTATHNAGKKVLINIGGASTESLFLSATNNTNRTIFINNLVQLMLSRGYDGIDVDWEPLSQSSLDQFAVFINQLRAAMSAAAPKSLLTAAAYMQPGIFAQLQGDFDQINLMTYEEAGPWDGIVWHNNPLYAAGVVLQDGTSAPSVDGMVNEFEQAGVKPGELGVGIEFYGALWQGGTGTSTGGVTAPGQSWSTPPTMTMFAYYDLMNSYYNASYYRRDESAKATYLSIESNTSANDEFISYDDEQSCNDKVSYARAKGLGGVMIFELGGGWRPNVTPSDSLLQAIKNAVSN